MSIRLDRLTWLPEKTSLDGLIRQSEPQSRWVDLFAAAEKSKQVDLDAGAEQSRWFDLDARAMKSRWVDLTTRAD